MLNPRRDSDTGPHVQVGQRHYYRLPTNPAMQMQPKSLSVLACWWQDVLLDRLCQLPLGS